MLAYLQLLRIPTVFTAMADIVLGFVLTHQYLYGPLAAAETDSQIGWNHPMAFLGLLLASCSLYLAGMVFNDVFDRDQDAMERPGRPIPSGRVSVRSATILGVILMSVGVTSAAFVSGVSFQVSLLLVAAILGYDSVLKRTPLGPLAMGSCRCLNVLLGGSLQTAWMPNMIGLPLVGAAVGLGLYITGVTVFARTEARVSSRWQLGLAQAIMNAGFAILVWMMITMPNRSPLGVSLAMLAVVALTVNRRTFRSLAKPIARNCAGKH